MPIDWWLRQGHAAFLQESMHCTAKALLLLQEAGVQQGYVQQDDLFFSQLTVRSALPLLWLYSAAARLQNP